MKWEFIIYIIVVHNGERVLLSFSCFDSHVKYNVFYDETTASSCYVHVKYRTVSHDGRKITTQQNTCLQVIL